MGSARSERGAREAADVDAGGSARRAATRFGRGGCAPPLRAERGQASVELVAILPFVALLAIALWQVALAGHAVWAGSAAARAAARAEAVGGDPERAALSLLPARLRTGAKLRAGDGEVELSIPIRALGSDEVLWTHETTARFEPQR